MNGIPLGLGLPGGAARPSLLDDLVRELDRADWNAQVAVAPAPSAATAGRSPVRWPGDLAAPALAAVADFLIAHAHGGSGAPGAADLDPGAGFAVLLDTPTAALAVLAGTAAALSGADIRAALVRPDAERLARLGGGAQAAIRDLARHVLVPADAAPAVRDGLRGELEAYS